MLPAHFGDSMSKMIFVNAFEYTYLGTRILASYLKQSGHETHNILLGCDSGRYVSTLQEKHHGYLALWRGKLTSNIANIFPLTVEDYAELERILLEEQPDIIGFSARSTNNHLIPHLVPVFRRAAPQALLVAGGYGPTLEPELYLDGGFDVVIRGDGEEALLELVNCHEKKDWETAVTLSNTVWSKDFGGHCNSMRDQEKDLEKYPPQLYGHEYFTVIAEGSVKRHFDPVIKDVTYTTYLGRGCTGKCTYCSGGQWRSLYKLDNKKSYPRRNRNYLDVINECASIPENIKFIFFMDEFWSMSKKSSAEFFSLYKDKVNKNFFAYLHYEQMVEDKKLFALAIDAGLSYTGIGFQSGSENMLRNYYGRRPQHEIMLEYAHMLFDNFIACTAQFISGNCYETWEDFLQTVDLARQLPFNPELPDLMDISVSRLRPHPKTPLTIIAPRVVTDPMPANEWLYRAMIIYLANKMEQEDLNEIMSMRMFKRDALQLIDFYRGWIYRTQRQHFEKLVAEGQEHDWIFYGAGENYLRNKNFFASLKPRAILVDRAYLPAEKDIQGTPIVCTEDFFAENNYDKDSRFLSFILSTNYGYPVSKKLMHSYNVPRNNIHSCEIDVFINGY